MSPNQDEVSTTPPLSLTVSRQDDEKTEGVADGSLSPAHIRHIVRLLQCAVCSRPLRVPVTLPCGKSICKACLPNTYRRANISYPGDEWRMQAFKCPFPTCRPGDHAIADCAVDVTLNKIMSLLEERLEAACNTHLAHTSDSDTGMVIRLVEGGQWVKVDISSQPTGEEPRSKLRFVPRDEFLAIYSLSVLGLVGYSGGITVDAISYNADDSSITVGDVTTTSEGAMNTDLVMLEQLKATVRAEVDCQVCYALFYDPLTTPCGHTFCRHCLHRALDRAAHCPICRGPVSVQTLIQRDKSPSNERFCNIIHTFWSEDVEKRRIAIEAEGHNQNGSIPVFVCTLSFPAMPTFLHVFEPRYRLMVRRALEGDRTFGMVLYKPSRPPDNAFYELGTFLRIVNVEYLPDGRSLLETVGISRFRIRAHKMTDGYVEADIDRINDISIPEEERFEAEDIRSRGSEHPGGESEAGTETTGTLSPTRKEDLDTMATRKLMEFATNFVNQMRGQSVTWLANRVLAIYGERPDNLAIFPWWFASILPVRDDEKYRLLATTSVRERLKICCEWILEWKEHRW